MRQQITEEFIKSLTKKELLALDIATHTGWFTAGHGYGTAFFPNTDKAPKRLGEDYDQHKAFRDWLMEKIPHWGIKLIAAEDVQVGKNFAAVRKLSEFRGILCEVCATLNIPLIFVPVTGLKKWATGNGNASKELMMEFAAKRWGVDMEGDDNAGDASHIFFYIAKRYKLT